MKDVTASGEPAYSWPTYLVYNSITQNNITEKTKFFETSVKWEYDTTNKQILFKENVDTNPFVLYTI